MKGKKSQTRAIVANPVSVENVALKSHSYACAIGKRNSFMFDCSGVFSRATTVTSLSMHKCI